MNLGLLGHHAPMDKTAFVSLPGEEILTYGDVARASDGVAAWLAERFEKGDKIAVLAENCGTYVTTVLGILKAAMVAVPVNWKLPDEKIADVIDDAGAVFAFADSGHAKSLPAGLGFLLLGTIAPASSPFSVDCDAKDAAIMLYTSGSTGRPKGVILSHGAHDWTAKTRASRASLAKDVTLIAAPLYHMQALTLAFYVLASGGAAVILPRFTTAGYLAAIEKWHCTYLTAVPPMVEALLRDPKIATTNLSTVKTVRLGSAPPSVSLKARIHDVMPSATVITSYGTTESGPVTFGAHPAGLPTPEFSVGYPHGAVSVRLNGEGVLEICSPALMNGYHNRPERQPFTADGYYRTGDVFSVDENGFYTFMGRADDMFVCGGENIYPGEVEAVIGTHHAVSAMCVVPVADEIKGEKPVAFVVAKSAVTEAEIKEYVLARAAPYLHPRRVWFVDALPLTDTNKIDRKALKALAAANMKKEAEHAPAN